jgi:outer membrane protein OmpA-like peptidoglycan-associated protein
MLHYTAKQKILFAFLLMFSAITGMAQTTTRVQPVWWFGQSGAINFNHYNGTTQTLNKDLKVPTAFHEGKGVKPYFSLLTELRPGKTWGGMLNLAFDNRGGKFDQVMAPCNCPADLSTNLSYFTIEPSLRLAPFKSAFYLFAGPTVSFNVSRSFEYEQDKQPDASGDWSEIKKTLLSAQAGAGVDIPLSKKSSLTQMTLSPFASFQSDFGHNPRSIESWSIYTVRTGIALKFGTGKGAKLNHESQSDIQPIENQVQFSVRAPKIVPAGRIVKETFPLRNSVFFDAGSASVPNRYIQLDAGQAGSFREALLQDGQPANLNTGRSARQLLVYHNILNIIGDRLRSNPQSAILLTGAADKNAAEGKQMAENVKEYLVNVFGIDPSRITTEGREKPVIASEQPGATRELDLLREGDRRVDITSNSPELLLQVGGKSSPFLAPVQINAVQADPLDSHVIFTNQGASELLKSWSVSLTDEQGNVQRYGPFSNDQASVPGTTILKNNSVGNYKVMMTGETKSGNIVQKESFISLQKNATIIQEGLRYSILFDFDRSKTIASYEAFLADVVAPLIPENGYVIIHGHTDIIGEETYNHSLSHDRAKGTQEILEQALARAGKKGVRFETYGFGEDESMAPFENDMPEKRFYNRTVIIDIVPNK